MILKIVSVYTGIFPFSRFSLFYNLDNRLLWDDEAEPALMAKNIIKSCAPKKTDGRNSIKLFGVETNEDDICISSPWLKKSEV